MLWVSLLLVTELGGFMVMVLVAFVVAVFGVECG